MAKPELPKLSGITKALTTPEAGFEKMVRDAVKVELPPGPQSILLKFQESIEAGNAPKVEEVLPEAPKVELPKLPPLPKIEEALAKLPKPPELPGLPSPATSPSGSPELTRPGELTLTPAKEKYEAPVRKGTHY
ncbi:MAG: hypothetical protein ACE5Z5_09540 [Candidatus Bathyarchaeia archaeon]